MLGILPCGECVRGRVVHDVDPGLRQAGGDRHLLDQIVQSSVFLWVGGDRSGRREGDAIGGPIAGKGPAEGDRDGDHRSDEHSWSRSPYRPASNGCIA